MSDPVHDGSICGICGAFGGMPHVWVEGQCLLPHRNHSRATVGFCCAWCVDRHKLWLTEVVELYAGLTDVLEPGSIPDDTSGEYQKPRKQPASPAPLRLDAWAMLRDSDRLYRTGSPSDLPDVASVLAAHVEALYEHLGWTSTPPTTVSGAAAALIANSTALAAAPTIDEFDADLRWIRQALRRAHGITNPKPLFPCITVDCAGQVWRQDDGEQPKCAACGRLYGKLDIVRARAMHERTAS